MLTFASLVGKSPPRWPPVEVLLWNLPCSLVLETGLDLRIRFLNLRDYSVLEPHEASR